MDGYTVHNVTLREEMDAVVGVIFKAQSDPYMPSSAMFFPRSGYSAEHQSQDLAAARDRLWNDLCKADSEKCGWIYIRQTATNEVAGASQWELHDASPFPNGCPKLDLSFWPEGDGKDFCEEMFQQAFTPRSLWMQREHGGINNMAVHPRHRGRGVGSMLVREINKIMDARGIESFLEASDLGCPCYARNGYITVMKLDFFLPAGKPDGWQRLFHEMRPAPWYAMWRPANGDSSSAPGRERPWQLGPSLPV